MSQEGMYSELSQGGDAGGGKKPCWRKWWCLWWKSFNIFNIIPYKPTKLHNTPDQSMSVKLKPFIWNKYLYMYKTTYFRYRYWINKKIRFQYLILDWGPGRFIKTGGLHDELGHGVGVAVAAGPPVLQVAITLECKDNIIVNMSHRTDLGGHLPGNPDAGAPVGHARGELVHGGGLVEASQPPPVVLPLVRVIVNNMPAKKLLNSLFSRLKCLNEFRSLETPLSST